MSTPNSGQHDKLLEHNYDGIQEYDNPMPSWWTAIFVVSIVFSVGYWLYYHTAGSGTPVHDDYAEEMRLYQEKAAAFAMAEMKEEDFHKLMADPEVIAKGAAKFKETCAACHGDKGEGKIGPNLTDSAWIHGAGSMVDLYKVIGNGVPEKGMPTWSRSLKPEELKAVTAFVGSIRNTNVPGKPAQGTPVAAQVPAAVPAHP